MRKPKKTLAEFPLLVRQWHPDNNRDAVSVPFKSGFKAKWRCDKGHEWVAYVFSRTRGSGCPVCAGKKPTPERNLAVVHPSISKEWNFTRNDSLPEDFLPRSNKAMWWICDKGHEWRAVIGNRTAGTSCPKCAGMVPSSDNNLEICYPGIAQEWNHDRNELVPKDYLPISGQVVWWICSDNHEWKSSISNRTAGGKGCPFCAGKRVSDSNSLLAMFPSLATEWHSKNREGPESVVACSNKRAWWQCEKGHIWKARISSRSSDGNGCPTCSIGNISKAGTNWLNSLGVSAREHRIKLGRKTYIVDGFDYESNTVFEFLGDYWHGNPRKFNPLSANLTISKKFGDLFAETFQRFNLLYKAGFRIVYKWESGNDEIYKSSTSVYGIGAMMREVARMLNITYNDETGQVFVLMEITDPAMRQDLLRGDVVARLVVDEKEKDDADL